MQSRKRILIVYYSLSGNTERVARDLGARLDADVEQIRERTVRKGFLGYLRAALDSLREKPAQLIAPARDAHDYELTLVGTPIWAGRITPAARSYLRTIRGQVNDIAFFTTSGNTDVSRVVPAMEHLAGVRAAACVGFTDRELREPALYTDKVTAFVATLRRGRTRPSAGEGLVNVHA